MMTTARKGYQQNMTSTKTVKRTEYEVVAQITHRLRDTAQNKAKDFPSFVSALDDNRRLWQAFAMDVASDANPLPKELRARIVYLAEFTDLHTKKVLRQKETVMPLLEINMAILRGLKTEGQTS